MEDGVEPAGRLEAERRRHRLLKERSCGHRRRAVSAGELRTSVGEALELCQHEPDGATGDEHRGRIHDVLARCSEMDEVSGLVADGRPELADERLRRVSDPSPVFGEPRGVEELGPASL